MESDKETVDCALELIQRYRKVMEALVSIVSMPDVMGTFDLLTNEKIRLMASISAIGKKEESKGRKF